MSLPAIVASNGGRRLSLGWTMPIAGTYGNVKPEVSVPYEVRDGETSAQAFDRAFGEAQWLLMAATQRMLRGYSIVSVDPFAACDSFILKNPQPPSS